MIVHYELLASLISHADYLNLQSYRLLLGMQFFPGVPLSYQIDKFKSGEINDIWLLPVTVLRRQAQLCPCVI